MARIALGSLLLRNAVLVSPDLDGCQIADSLIKRTCQLNEFTIVDACFKGAQVWKRDSA